MLHLTFCSFYDQSVPHVVVEASLCSPHVILASEHICYDLGLELSERHTLILSNTRELNRVLKYKLFTLYTNY